MYASFVCNASLSLYKYAYFQPQKHSTVTAEYIQRIWCIMSRGYNSVILILTFNVPPVLYQVWQCYETFYQEPVQTYISVCRAQFVDPSFLIYSKMICCIFLLAYVYYIIMRMITPCPRVIKM